MKISKYVPHSTVSTYIKHFANLFQQFYRNLFLLDCLQMIRGNHFR